MLWGAAADAQRFDGASAAGQVDGGVTSLYLGVDARFGANWLAGAALSRSLGRADYSVDGRSGRLKTELTGIHPYVRGETGSGLELWAIGGLGSGEAEDRSDHAGASPEASGLKMAMAAAGLRQPLTQRRGVQFSVVGAAGFVSLRTDEGDRLRAVDGLDAAVTQGRLALEVSRASGAWMPYLRLGARFDGGDGVAGSGAEVIGGLRYAGGRVDFEAQARWLAAHSGEDYKEYGGMARLTLSSRADGSGLRLSLAPSWGAAGGGTLLGMHSMLGSGAGTAGDLSGIGRRGAGLHAGSMARLSLDSELGYGYHWPRLRGLVSPVVMYGSGNGWSTIGTGLAYQSQRPLLGSNLRVELSIAREQRLAAETIHQALLKFTLVPWGPDGAIVPTTAPGAKAPLLYGTQDALASIDVPGGKLPLRPAVPEALPLIEAVERKAAILPGAREILAPIEVSEEKSSLLHGAQQALAPIEVPVERSSLLHGAREVLAPIEVPGFSAPVGEQEAYLRDLPKNYYAVQLMALRHGENVGVYVAKNGLEGSLKARVARDGETLHVLILGVYADIDSARRAVANLPPALQDITPWVRSLGSLQQAMRHTD